MDEPALSVVIPARDSAATLPLTLAALHGQGVEVVVVDDASSDDTAALAEAGGAVVVRLAEQSGPAAARNAGVAASHAPLLAFTDADCVPAPGWTAAITAALADDDLVTGPVLPEPGRPVGPFDRTLHLAGPSPRFESANLGVRRELFERIGGFAPFVPDGSPGLRPTVAEGHFGEDAVFGWRARRIGARVGFAPDALVHHAVFARDARGYVAERRRTRYFPALVREIPELRESMPAGLFLGPRTLRFDAALIGVTLAAARRSPWPLLLVAPYARRDLRRHRALSRGGLRENAAHVAADAVGLAGLLRGSVAARRLLL
ncbi:MAG: glycosyltransferase [Solirubrobacteraceae bacterium]